MALIRDYRIVIGSNPAVNERRAAAFVARYIRLMTGVEPLAVTDESQPEALEIVIGRTNRETLDGLTINREPSRQWEFQVFSAGSRLYITGLGCPAREDETGLVVKDGCVGTVYGAYHFVDQILGYRFVYESFDSCPFAPDKAMPEGYFFARTLQALEQLPPKVEGSVMYSLPNHLRAELNQYCLIFKTRQGKLAVMDSGRTQNAPHILRCLQELSGEEKPVVSTWFLTHTHDDHSGGFIALCADPELYSRITVEHVYHRLVSDAYYLELAADRHPDHAKAAAQMRQGIQTLGAQEHVVSSGDKIRLDEMCFEVLYAPDEALGENCSINDSSLVFKLSHDSGQSILLLVDAEDRASEYLLESCPQKLRCDIVQVAHHGCNGAPYELYRLTGARAALFNCCNRYWYGDNGEGLFTFNVGHIRTRNMLRQLGMKPENIYCDSDGILTVPLPFEFR